MSDTTPIPPASERERFEAWCRENYLCSEHSFARAPDGYAHVVSHRVLRGCYANVQMLWEAFRDARAALSHHSTPQGWQSMDSAPKDGRRVLVAIGELVGEAWYDDQDGDYHAGWYWANENWTDAHVSNPIYPNAWQPLPPPPEQGGKG